jgi:hypothetical protein
MIVNPDDLSCKELVELVTDYAEDRLPLDVRARFEMHLGYCASCRVYVAFRGWKRGQGGDA